MIHTIKSPNPFKVTTDLLQHCPAVIGSGHPVYVSGSLVEGYGNSMSDVDVFVISDMPPEGEHLIRKDKFIIDIRFEGNRRIDFEYWNPQYVKGIADKLRKIEPGKDFVAEKLEPVEELFIHRIRIGVPIQEESKFNEIRAGFDFVRFNKYLVQQAIHRIDGAIEDLVGLLDDQDIDTAMFRAISLVGISTDAWCYHRGNSNPLEKWRVKKLAGLPDTPEDNRVREQFFSLSLPAVSLRNDRLACIAFIESCMNFAHETCFNIQQ